MGEGGPCLFSPPPRALWSPSARDSLGLRGSQGPQCPAWNPPPRASVTVPSSGPRAGLGEVEGSSHCCHLGWWPWGQSCEGGLGRALADCVHYGTESSQWPRVRDRGYPALQKREPRPRAAAPHPQRFCSRPAATPPLSWSQPPIAHQPSAWHVGLRW